VTGPNSDELILKQGDKEYAHIEETVSADGKTLTSKYTNYAGEKAATGVVTEKRLRYPAPGSSSNSPAATRCAPSSTP